MKTLEQQLIRYGEIVEQAQQATAIENIVSDRAGEVIELRPPHEQRRRWVWAIVAAVVMILLVVLPSLTSPEPPTATDPTPTTTTPTESMLSSPVAVEGPHETEAFGSLTWIQFMRPSEDCVPAVRATQDGRGYVADWCSTAWVSDDGAIWSEAIDAIDSGVPAQVDTESPCVIGPDPDLDCEATTPAQMALEGGFMRGWVSPAGLVHFGLSPDGFDWDGVDGPTIPEVRPDVAGTPGGAGHLLYWGYSHRDVDVLWVGVLGAAGIADLARDAITPLPDGDPTAAPTGPVRRDPDYPDELESDAGVPAASVLVEPGPFQLGDKTFGIAEVQTTGPEGSSPRSWFAVVEDGGGGEWRQVPGAVHGHLPTVTVSEGGVVVASPGTSGVSERCVYIQVTVSVSEDGEVWTTSAIDDLGAVSEPTDSPTRQDCFQWGDQGGEAIGPAGFLVVRHLTRCCVDPANYPHFWFSADGVAWRRVDMPDRIDTIEESGGCGHQSGIGRPTATESGFEIEVEFSNGDGVCPTERWGSADGVEWSPIDDNLGSRGVWWLSER